MRLYRLLCVFILGLISHIALVQAVPVDTGSEVALKESAMQESDKETGKTFIVYQSVKNEGLAKEGKFSEMTFYIAPLFRLIPNTDGETKVAYGRTVLEEDGIVQYTFWVECFAPRIEAQALDTINNHYQKYTQGKYVFSEEKVKHMQHGMVVIKPANLPPSLMKVIKPARIPSTGNTSSTVLLDEIMDFTIYVPKERDSTFETLLKDRGIRFDFTVYFNVMNLSRLQMSWSAKHVSDSKTYKTLTSGGDYYVTAGQVNQIIREAAANKGAFVYLDPDIDDKIWDKSLEIFQKMTGALQSLTVRNQAQAKQLEEKLRQGMGLSAKDFQPITLMWNVAEEIQTIEDYEEANEVIRNTYQRNKRAFEEAKKKGRDVSIQVSGSARFSFAKAATSLGVKMHSNHSINVDELDDKVEKGYLSNNDDLKKYKSKLRKLKGQKIKIVGRGLDLIESSQLKQKLNLMASYVFVQPMREAKTFTTSSKISSSAKKGRGDILINKVAEMDRRLMRLENSLVPKAQKTADDAIQRANRAQGTADDAVQRANRAQGTADDAVQRANHAQGTANHAVNLANRAQGTANTALSKFRWEDITSDKGHFNINCQYKWITNPKYGNTTFYASAVRHDAIWVDYGAGNWASMNYHNKSISNRLVP